MAIRDITLGQYYPSESIIHRLDPRTKVIATLAYLVALFICDSVISFAAAAAFLAAVIILSKVPFKFITKGLKPIVLVIILTLVLNLFMTPGEALVSFWKLTITKEGVARACMIAVRLILLVIGSSLLTFTTKPIALTDGLEKLLWPLSKIGLPAHELAMMMSIALRFIPTLLEETDKIMKAQTSRGADFESGNLIQRAKSLIPLLVPLFVSAFRIASDLAMAMESRCYRGGEGRTRMNGMAFALCDLAAALCMAGFIALVVIL